MKNDPHREVRAGPGHLSGQLLVGTPQTGGAIFRRSVVLVLHHDDRGAHGVVLNRPLDAPVAAVLPDWDAQVTPPDCLFQGGPVGLDSALGLVTVPGGAGEPMGVRLLFGGLGLVDLDIPPPVVMPELAGLRVYVGYSGWGAGQLEEEIEHGGWYVVDAEPRDAFLADTSGLWKDVLTRQRSNLSFVATFPEDPGAN